MQAQAQQTPATPEQLSSLEKANMIVGPSGPDICQLTRNVLIGERTGCGGKLPEKSKRGPEYYTRPDGKCPGHLQSDNEGNAVGCGAFVKQAYGIDFTPEEKKIQKEIAEKKQLAELNAARKG